MGSGGTGSEQPTGRAGAVQLQARVLVERAELLHQAARPAAAAECPVLGGQLPGAGGGLPVLPAADRHAGVLVVARAAAQRGRRTHPRRGRPDGGGPDEPVRH